MFFPPVTLCPHNVSDGQEVVDQQQIGPPVLLAVDDFILGDEPEGSPMDHREESDGHADDEQVQGLDSGQVGSGGHVTAGFTI